MTNDDELEIPTLPEARLEILNHLIEGYNRIPGSLNTGSISDGYHTFDELYAHRSMLWVCLLNLLHKTDEPFVWKSRTPSDGSMFEGYFIAGVRVDSGKQMSYHLKMEYWDKLDVPEYVCAPEWDGHTSSDVLERLERWFC